MDGFSCRSFIKDNSVIVVVEGELDIHTAPALRAELVLALAHATNLVIDCAGIVFTDSAGLRPMEWAAQRCAESHTDLTLRQIPRSMARLVRLLGLEGTLAPHSPGGLGPDPDPGLGPGPGPGFGPERANAGGLRLTSHRCHFTGRVPRRVEGPADHRPADCRYSR